MGLGDPALPLRLALLDLRRQSHQSMTSESGDDNAHNPSTSPAKYRVSPTCLAVTSAWQAPQRVLMFSRSQRPPPS